jgi:hypothetical protein
MCIVASSMNFIWMLPSIAQAGGLFRSFFDLESTGFAGDSRDY